MKIRNAPTPTNWDVEIPSNPNRYHPFHTEDFYLQYKFDTLKVSIMRKQVRMSNQTRQFASDVLIADAVLILLALGEVSEETKAYALLKYGGSV